MRNNFLWEICKLDNVGADTFVIFSTAHAIDFGFADKII